MKCTRGAFCNVFFLFYFFLWGGGRGNRRKILYLSTGDKEHPYNDKLISQCISFNLSPSIYLSKMTSQSDKFCLKWTEFQNNMISSYHELRQDPDFSDVTLVCEDDHSIEAHRIILMACSPFFSNVLKKTNHSHPMIYMRRIKSKDLVAILDFIYLGEANIFKEDLDGFLALAEELQLKGLTGSRSKTELTRCKTKEETEKPLTANPKKQATPEQHPYSHPQIVKEKTHEKPLNPDLSDKDNRIIFSLDLGKIGLSLNTEFETIEIKARIDSMIGRVLGKDYKFQCSLCGKTSNNYQVMGNHVETHIEGLSYHFNQSEKVSRSSQGRYIIQDITENRKM